MPNTTNWREIRQRRPPNETAAALEKLQLPSHAPRQVGASQVDVAEALGTSQSNVSQLERSNDQMLSSIAKYVHALGGELRMTAVVGNTTYTLLDDVSELALKTHPLAADPQQKGTRAAESARRSSGSKGGGGSKSVCALADEGNQGNSRGVRSRTIS